MEAVHSKSDGKQADWSRYGHKAQKIVRKNLKSRLVRMRSRVRIALAAQKFKSKNRIRKPFLGFWVRFLFFSVQGVWGQVLKQSGSQKVVKKQAADPGRLPLKINRFCPCLPLFPLRSYTGMNRYKPGSH